MRSRDLKSEIRAVLKDAAHAADGAGGNLPDRTDLLRLVARLRRTLARLNRAHDELELVYQAFTETMCRSHTLTDSTTHCDAEQGRARCSG